MHLNCHTFYSLKYGTLSPHQLVAQAAALGHKVLALTDINNTSCAIEFCQLCRSHGIRPILGLEFREANVLKYVGIARNARGWNVLCNRLTQYLTANISLPLRLPYHPDVFVLYPVEMAGGFQTWLPHEFAGLRSWDAGSRAAASLPLDRCVWLLTATLGDEQDYLTHRLLQSMQQKVTYAKLDRSQLADPRCKLLDRAAWQKLRHMHPEISQNTMRIGRACTDDYFKQLAPNLNLFTKAKAADEQLLRSLAIAGLRKRYGAAHTRHLSRLEQELSMICRLDFSCYFLVVWDVIRYARSQGLHHVGRGSGANSLVAFCLWITDVDPIELNLYFERFINPHRPKPPDFDIDFNWTDRDQMVDYLINRYGTEKAAPLASYQTFKGKSIVREMGKVLGLSKKDMDLIIREPLAKDKHHPLANLIFQHGKKIQRFPRHLSLHAGGVIIASRELSWWSAQHRTPKGYHVTQFDMRHADQMGFHKIDILSQRGLGHIADAVKMISASRNQRIDIHDLSMIKRDAATSRQLSSGNAIGCFYIESPAMRGLLKKLHCQNYIDLIAATSIIRPGVAKSGMMQAYIHRRAGRRFTYLHEHFKLLKETYGIMVYQEDVMQIVHAFADFDMYQADVMRRLMTGKQKDAALMVRLKRLFHDQAVSKGHSSQLIQEVWRQVASFSGYAFCKAHSATYAAESLQSLYLKAHFPREFLVAVINNFGGFYSTEVYVRELQKMGVEVVPPCLNRSRYLSCICGSDVILGFVHVKSLRKTSVKAIAKARLSGGRFANFEDAVQRIRLTLSQWEILIRVGALDFTGLPRAILHRRAISQHNRQDKTPRLFDSLETTEIGRYDPPPYHQRSIDEVDLLGFSIKSPFDWQASTAGAQTILAGEMGKHAGEIVAMLGYFVIKKPVTTIGGMHMCFGTFYDPAFDFFDTVHFPNVLHRFPLQKKGVYLIQGRVLLDNGFPTLEVMTLNRLKSRGNPQEQQKVSAE